MTEYAIEIEGLNKTYAGHKKSPAKRALIDVDLKIPKGSIFGLLGPNGAGKSTIINIMSDMVFKTSGSVKIWGYDIAKDMRAAKSAIGIVPQEINYDVFFSPLELLDLMAGLYGVPKAERRSMELIKLVGLEEKAHAYTRSLSGGMKRRLMIAKAMVHSPPILVLDEPTAGVDVELRRQLWENVRLLNAQGVTILLTTHYLEEAEELCDRIAIIDHGKIIKCEDKEDLLAEIDGKEIRFRMDTPFDSVPDALGKYGAVKEGRRSLIIRYTPGEQSIDEIVRAVQGQGFNIFDISTNESDLEDIFVQLTGS